MPHPFPTFGKGAGCVLGCTPIPVARLSRACRKAPPFSTEAVLRHSARAGDRLFRHSPARRRRATRHCVSPVARYHSAAFPQPFAENHFGVLFLYGNIRHDTPRNSSFSAPDPPSFTRRRRFTRRGRFLFHYLLDLLYLLSFQLLAHSSIFRTLLFSPQLPSLQWLAHSFAKTGGCVPTLPKMEHSGFCRKRTLAIRSTNHESPACPLLIYPFSFLHLAHSFAQWTLHNSFRFKCFRTLSIATEV